MSEAVMMTLLSVSLTSRSGVSEPATRIRSPLLVAQWLSKE